MHVKDLLKFKEKWIALRNGEIIYSSKSLKKIIEKFKKEEITISYVNNPCGYLSPLCRP